MTISEELRHITQLINQCQYSEALNRIESLEKQSGFTDITQIRIFLLKGTVLNLQGQYEGALKLSKQALEGGKGLDEPLIVVDALIIQEEVLWKLGRLDESYEAIEQGLQELTKIKNDSKTEKIQREAYLIRHKGIIFLLRGDLNQGIEYQFQSLKLYERIGDKQEIAACLSNIGRTSAFKGELDLALEHMQRSFDLAKEVDNKHDIAYYMGNIAYIYYLRGDLDQSIDYSHRLLSTLEEIGSKQDYAYSIAIFHLILLYTDRGDLNQARYYLQRIHQINKNETNKIITQMSKLAEALVIKKSPRMKEKVKALEILQQLLKEDIVFPDTKVLAMLHLCEILIDELKFFGEEEVYTQIKALLTQIHDDALKQQSHPLMVESLILKAKFALVDGDAQGADQFLDQAKFNAEERGLDLLRGKITEEQEKLQNELDKWGELTERNASLKERFAQAQFGDYLKSAQKIVRLSGRL